ncbi:conserved oligomeric Golgi complex subunit 2-like [Vespa mandarinia]|uniref:conserved oligomeric Golgi complex subunit 2-like n=1 Tax=Vespa mandarinia TaxID=7446 RepID=UPI00160AF641|nr:conserved oligomeric Golgi complex subunit 2-like [Vespa mandarinia]
MSDDKTSLPVAPKDLCFFEHEFIQSNFNVDTFLHNHRRVVKLETMRDDLGIYLKLLRSAMIDLINRDYTDFVNLSSNLIGLDKAISSLEMPLSQLREEVMQIQQTLNEEIIILSNNLNDDSQIKLQKQSLHSLQCVYKCLRKLSSMLSMDNYMESFTKIDVLEQATAELNHLKFNASRCRSDISIDQQTESKKLEDLLITHLNELFLVCIHEKDSNLLIRCLRIYIMLDNVTTAELVVRRDVISPIINNILQDEDSQTEFNNLQSIYNRLLNILSGELKQLLDITLYSNRIQVKGFNFLVNSFWIEIEEKIDQQLKYIFAPGNPELFHKRYTETMWFRKKLEEFYNVPAHISILKDHLQYKNFLKKWNLPVYFQIRFQEIAGTVETAFKKSISPELIKGSANILMLEEFSLYTTSIVWNCLYRIWSENIYLSQLFQEFWKLTLQVCSRYQTWACTAIRQKWQESNKSESIANSNRYTKLDFLIHLYCDVEKFVNGLPNLLRIVQLKNPNQNPATFKLLEDCLTETSKTITMILQLTTEEIVNELIMHCVIYLKQVSDIPRLYRRTNREVPTKPCAYVKNALSFLTSFRTNYNDFVPTNVTIWLQLALSLLTECYLTSVTDVLTSVQKTEESLRRLKKIRDKSTGVLTSDAQGISDDEKIRIQLQIDVNAYSAMITELDVPVSDISHLQELSQAVEAALKK